MKAWIDSEEWYPVYTINKQNFDDEEPVAVEIDSIFYERYLKVRKEFKAVQRELAAMLGDEGRHI